MPVNQLLPRRKPVTFFACDVTEMPLEAIRAANDNPCPYCGGVLEPGELETLERILKKMLIAAGDPITIQRVGRS